MDADLTNLSEVTRLFERTRPDALIHAAALVGGIGGNLMQSGRYFYENSLINLNVLETARLHNVNNLVTFMSTCIFPADAHFPLTVDQLHAGHPHESNFGYAYSKRMLEVQTRAYNLQWGTTFKILIPANMYGPGDNFNLREAHVVPALVHKVHIAKSKNSDLEVWGSGKPKREFVFSQDVAAIAIEALTTELTTPLIVSNGSEVSIKTLAEIVAKNFEFSGKILFDTSKPEGQFRKPSDTSKLDALFPHFQFTSLQDGLAQTIRWFSSNYPNIRM